MQLPEMQLPDMSSLRTAWDNFLGVMSSGGGKGASYWLSHFISLAIILAVTWGANWTWDRLFDSRFKRVVDVSFQVYDRVATPAKKAAGRTAERVQVAINRHLVCRPWPRTADGPLSHPYTCRKVTSWFAVVAA